VRAFHCRLFSTNLLGMLMVSLLVARSYSPMDGRFTPGNFARSVSTGPEKIQKINSSVLACLRDTQENQVLLNTFLCRCSGDHMPKPGECLNGVLSIVVVPRNSVVMKKSEQFLAAFLETLFTLRLCRLIRVICGYFQALMTFRWSESGPNSSSSKLRPFWPIA
jgi:hypothetical protein